MMGKSLLLILGVLTALSQLCFKNLADSANHNLPYNSNEIRAIDELRPLVEPHLALDFQQTNAYLLRWLRINNFVVADAAEDLKKNHKWRNEYKIDQILDEPAPNDLPFTVDGLDRAGRPIVILHFGKWNIRKAILAGRRDSINRQLQRMFEIGIRKTFEIAEREGKDVDQAYLLADIQGYKVGTHACAACLPVIMEFIQTVAYGTWPFLKNITAVNSPLIFYPVVSLARTIITELPIYNYNPNRRVWKEAILKDIAPDQLPRHLGGTRQSKVNPQKKMSSPKTLGINL